VLRQEITKNESEIVIQEKGEKSVEGIQRMQMERK
jgi:hypothetical protein